VPALIAFQGYNAGHLPLQGVNAGSGELAINLAQKSGFTWWQMVPRRTFLKGPTRWMFTGWGTGGSTLAAYIPVGSLDGVQK
jgi:hypothetical protein